MDLRLSHFVSSNLTIVLQLFLSYSNWIFMMCFFSPLLQKKKLNENGREINTMPNMRIWLYSLFKWMNIVFHRTEIMSKTELTGSELLTVNIAKFCENRKIKQNASSHVNSKVCGQFDSESDAAGDSNRCWNSRSWRSAATCCSGSNSTHCSKCTGCCSQRGTSWRSTWASRGALRSLSAMEGRRSREKRLQRTTASRIVDENSGCGRNEWKIWKLRLFTTAAEDEEK